MAEGSSCSVLAEKMSCAKTRGDVVWTKYSNNACLIHVICMISSCQRIRQHNELLGRREGKACQPCGITNGTSFIVQEHKVLKLTVSLFSQACCILGDIPNPTLCTESLQMGAGIPPLYRRPCGLEPTVGFQRTVISTGPSPHYLAQLNNHRIRPVSHLVQPSVSQSGQPVSMGGQQGGTEAKSSH